MTSDGGDGHQILDGIPDEVLGDILVVAAQVSWGISKSDVWQYLVKFISTIYYHDK